MQTSGVLQPTIGKCAQPIVILQQIFPELGQGLRLLRGLGNENADRRDGDLFTYLAQRIFRSSNVSNEIVLRRFCCVEMVSRFIAPCPP